MLHWTMLTTLYLLIASLFPQQEKYTISGTVIDFETKQPITAMISVRRGNAIVVADEDGNFKLEPKSNDSRGTKSGRLTINAPKYLGYSIILPMENLVDLDTIEMFQDYGMEFPNSKNYTWVKNEVILAYKGNNHALDFKEEIKVNVDLTKPIACK
ncbi:MAG: hypothetical protein ABJP45_18735 [Cyclobacteriaceae bacterium]